MENLKFADTYNMVAYLSKPKESDGFEQIVDFLNAHPIKYALTVNPIIYTLCIEQFWSTVKAKTINGEVQLHALVDGKKIIITESTVRRDLQLEDAEGIDCLPNSTIFKELTRMGYEKISQKLTFYKAFFSPQWKFLIHTILQCLSSKTTAWNEFSSTMASAIICLATNKKFNFSKYIFESMVRNLDNLSGKFLCIQDEVVHKDLGDSLVRAATTASSLEVEQDSGNIVKTTSKETPNEVGSQGTTSGGGPRINAIDADEDITLVNVQDDDDNEIFDVDALIGDDVFAEQEVAAKDVNLTFDEVTLAQALAALKSVKPKVKGDVIKEPSVPVRTASASTKISATITTTATILTPRKGIVITELGTPIITRSSQQPSQAKFKIKEKEK
ncbi:hypothetical protein Tco_1437657 [Tanacetum coccineum]